MLRAALERLYRFISSLGIGVALLALIALILAAATKFESNTSTHLVQVYVYHTRWFDVLLGLFAVNLGLATWNLRPFRLRHTGVLMIHSSLIVILLGAWITRNFGFEGSMVIEEGETVDRITLSDMVLAVYDPERPTEPLERFHTWYSGSPPREHLNDRYTLRTGETLTVDRYYTDALPVVTVQDGGAAENPALHFRVGSSMAAEESWLFPRQPGEDRVDFGGMLEVRAAEFSGEDQWREALEKTSAGRLSFTFHGHSYEKSLTDLAEILEFPGGYKLRLLRGYRNFRVDNQGRYTDSAGPAMNPAVEFVIHRDGIDDHYLHFARLPDFDPLRSEQPRHPRVEAIRFEADFDEDELLEGQILLGLLPGGIRAAWLVDGQSVDRPVTVDGEPLSLPWADFRLSVDRHYRKAWRAEDMRNVGVENKNPALRVRADQGELVEQHWLGYGQRRTFTVDDRDLLVAFEPVSVPLGFRLRLDDFVKDVYPGSAMAAGYASYVTLFPDASDTSDGQGREVEISMNNTLVHGGFKFFQSSFLEARHPGARESTILSVNHDPGHLVVYLGSTGLVLGLIVVFFFKKRMIAFERRSGSEKGL